MLLLLVTIVLVLLHFPSSSPLTPALPRRAFLSTVTALTLSPLSLPPSHATPPTPVIAEELGYFPVTTDKGGTRFVPARIKHQSTDQAIELAKHLKSKGVIFYSAYW